MPLDEWFTNQNGVKPVDLLISVETNLDFRSFESFIDARTALPKHKLVSLIGKADELSQQG